MASNGSDQLLAVVVYRPDKIRKDQLGSLQTVLPDIVVDAITEAWEEEEHRIQDLHSNRVRADLVARSSVGQNGKPAVKIKIRVPPGFLSENDRRFVIESIAGEVSDYLPGKVDCPVEIYEVAT